MKTPTKALVSHAETAPDISPCLQGLCRPEEYRAQRERFFGSPGSLEWFRRRHARELVEAGAIVTIAGRTYFRETVFDELVVRIGQAEVARELHKRAAGD